MASGSTSHGARHNEGPAGGPARTGQDKGKAADLAHQAQEAAGAAAQKAGEFASQVGQKVQDTASQVAQRVQDAAATARDRAAEALPKVGERMTHMADTLRQQAPREGWVGSTAETVAGGLQASGQYLQQHQLDDIVGDVGTLMRRYPLQSILIGFGLGFLVGNAMSRR